ncbi:MAG: ATP-binding protein [Anaerolineales bacterium]|jgi:signal transduction histidine kinase/HAMP domain-containing protein
MTLELWGFQGGPSLRLPLHTVGYVLLILEIVFGVGLFWFSGGLRRIRARLEWIFRQPAFILLLLAAPLAARIFIVEFSTPAALVPPGVPAAVEGPTFAIFGALPWIFAAGMFGELPAMLIAFLSGLVTGAWGTHSLLTPLHYVIQAGVAAWLMRQNYSELPARAARVPVVSAMIGGLVYGVLRTIERYAYSGGGFYDGLDFAFSLMGATLLAAVLHAGLAGLFATWIRSTGRVPWFQPQQTIVGPYNRSLASRLLSLFLVLGIFSSGILLYGDWLLAQRSARDLLEGQMVQMGEQIGGAIPFFVQTGRSIEAQLAESYARELNQGEISEARLQSTVRSYAFFQSLIIYDRELETVSAYPTQEIVGEGTPFELGAALDSVLLGLPQEVVLRPARDGGAARLAFLAPLTLPDGDEPIGAMVGVTELDANPYLLPIVDLIEDISPGQAFIVDAQGTILLHTNPSRVLQEFEAEANSAEEVITDTAPDGTRRMIYTHAIEGYPWQIVIVTPQSEIQKVAIRIAANLFGVLALVGVVFVLAIYLISRRLTRPLRMMAGVAQSIARGNLEQPVLDKGEDEIGQLALSFERMRRRLKARLDEMSLLMNASQEFTRSFDLSRSLPPILDGIRELTDADLVRLSLEHPETFESRLEVYSAGVDPGNWAALDSQVLALTRDKGRFTLENPGRAKAVLNIEALSAPIEALSSIPLQNEDVFVGALWLGYRQPHVFTPDELRLLSILSAQLGVAVSNTRLFQRAEQERLRLTAVLEATPDAVILVDQRDRISLANPASEIVLNKAPEEALGVPIEQAVKPQSLLSLLIEPGSESRSSEISLPNGQVLYASVSDIPAEEEGASGRVCVLWDITHYKKLDTLKSEFVSTVSHDLRAPLTLMRGYATMLTMVGAMNEQQKEFVSKILGSADQMGELIENLLDLGRLEAGIRLDLESVPVGDVIQSVLDSYRPQAVNKQIDLEVELSEEMQPLEVDTTLIRQAIANLVDNALKYTPAKGEVNITAFQRNERQIVQVRDSGVGIAPTDQARLFEKFYRARGRATLNVKGSGLGLAIVKSIMQLHGGKVAVDSKLGEGSVFTLEFPIHPEEIVEPEVIEG